MKVVECKETVQFYDTDCGAVVSNIAYLRFVERARAALFAELGMDLLSLSGTQLFPTVIRTEIDYRYPARLGEELTVTATLAAVEKVRVRCDFSLTMPTEGGDRRVVAEARQFVALVQMPEGRPRRIPSEWLILTE